MANKKNLYKKICRILMDNVSAVGADINRAVAQPWAAGTIQFVAGLGPRKAKQLLEFIHRSQGSIISNREDLTDPVGILGPCVYENAAGFLRINKKYLDDFSDYSPLDDSRIHPSDYALVTKLATDVLPQDEDIIETVFENPQVLSGIDWDAFAEALKEKGKAPKVHTLKLVRQEIAQPFKDPRDLYKDPSHQLVWKLMVGEDEDTLMGQLIFARVVVVKEERVLCRLENGIEAVIQKSDISDNPVENIITDVNIQKGSAIQARIQSVDIDHLIFNLVCRSSELRSSKWEEVQLQQLHEMEPYCNPNFKPKTVAKPRRQPINRKRIEHPLFKDLNFTQAEEFLEKKHIGDFIIRPSSKNSQSVPILIILKNIL